MKLGGNIHRNDDVLVVIKVADKFVNVFKRSTIARILLSFPFELLSSHWIGEVVGEQVPSELRMVFPK